MTDRLRGFTVLLDRDIRDADFESIKQAILMNRYVKEVEPVINASDTYITEMKVRMEVKEKLFKVIEEL